MEANEQFEYNLEEPFMDHFIHNHDPKMTLLDTPLTDRFVVNQNIPKYERRQVQSHYLGGYDNSFKLIEVKMWFRISSRTPRNLSSLS